MLSGSRNTSTAAPGIELAGATGENVTPALREALRPRVELLASRDCEGEVVETGARFVERFGRSRAGVA